MKNYTLTGFRNTYQETHPQDHQVLHEALVDRLMDFGLYPGIEFQIVKTLHLSKVTVIKFEQTLLALNNQEFTCLVLK